MNYFHQAILHFQNFWFPRKPIFAITQSVRVPQLAGWTHWLSYEAFTAALDGKGTCQTSVGSCLWLAPAVCWSLSKYSVGQNGRGGVKERHSVGVDKKSQKCFLFSITEVKPRHIYFINAFVCEIPWFLCFWLSIEWVLWKNIFF